MAPRHRSKCKKPFPQELFTPEEIQLFQSLDTPEKINEYIESLAYDCGSGYKSVQQTIRTNKAHCAGGAMFAAACMWFHGFEPMISSILADETNDDDHMVWLYRINGFWGSISKSNFSVTRSRDPIYKNIRELFLTYFDFYFPENGLKSMRSYSVPVSLCRSKQLTQDWLIGTNDDMEWLDDLCDNVKYHNIVPKRQLKYCSKASIPLIQSAMLGVNRKGIFVKKKNTNEDVKTTTNSNPGLCVSESELVETNFGGQTSPKKKLKSVKK